MRVTVGNPRELRDCSFAGKAPTEPLWRPRLDSKSIEFQDSQSHRCAIFDNSSDAMLLFDDDGTYIRKPFTADQVKEHVIPVLGH
jgi:hypothetical protein